MGAVHGNIQSEASAGSADPVDSCLPAVDVSLPEKVREAFFPRAEFVEKAVAIEGALDRIDSIDELQSDCDYLVLIAEGGISNTREHKLLFGRILKDRSIVGTVILLFDGENVSDHVQIDSRSFKDLVDRNCVCFFSSTQKEAPPIESSVVEKEKIEITNDERDKILSPSCFPQVKSLLGNALKKLSELSIAVKPADKAEYDALYKGIVDFDLTLVDRSQGHFENHEFCEGQQVVEQIWKTYKGLRHQHAAIEERNRINGLASEAKKGLAKKRKAFRRAKIDLNNSLKRIYKGYEKLIKLCEK